MEVKAVLIRALRKLYEKLGEGKKPRAVQGLVLAGIGIAAGLAGAFALTRLLSSLLYGANAADPLTFAGVTVLLVIVAAAASFLPAWRATRVDSVIALRCE